MLTARQSFRMLQSTEILTVYLSELVLIHPLLRLSREITSDLVELACVSQPLSFKLVFYVSNADVERLSIMCEACPKLK